MIEKPECYGSPCVAALSPCHRCGVLAACARRMTQTQTFGLLMWPRVRGAVARDEAVLPTPLLFDPAVVAEVERHLGRVPRLIYSPRLRAWRVRNERVLSLREASASMVSIEVSKPPGACAAMRSASLGVEIVPRWDDDTRPADEASTVAALASYAAWAPSSVVSSVCWEPAARVAEEVVRVYFTAEVRDG